MKSMSLLLYKPDEGAMDETARDFNAIGCSPSPCLTMTRLISELRIT